jgi:hypothetical protein
VLERVSALVRLEDDVARARVDALRRQADAAEVHDPHPVDGAVDGPVRVPDEDEIGVCAGEPLAQLGVAVRGGGAVAVVAAGRRVHAEDAGAIRKRLAQLEWKRREPLVPAAGGDGAARPRERRGRVDHP